VTYWVRHDHEDAAPVSVRGGVRLCPTDGPLRSACRSFTSSARSSSSEYLRYRTCREPFGSKLAYPGFCPSSRPLRSASTCREHIPSARYVPPSDFLSPSTVCSAVRLVGLFHPTATCRVVYRSGASPPVQPFLPRREELPPCRSARPSSPVETGVHSSVPRLRGLAPHGVALSAAWCYPPRSSLPSSGSLFLRALASAVPCSYLRGSTPDVAPADLRLRDGPLRPSSASRRRRP
jgi:hypothetical protein